MRKNIINIAGLFFTVLILLTGCDSGKPEPAYDVEENRTSISSPAGNNETTSDISQPAETSSGENTAVDTLPSENNSSATASGGTINSEMQESQTTDASGGGSVEQQKPLTQTFTIPEGYTLPRIGMLLEEKGICATEEFIAASQNGDFSEFPLVAAQNASPNRCFKLEGYLFPDTYEIYSSDPPDTIIRRILAHTEQKISADLREKIKNSGYSIDEILSLASIIEKEAFGNDQMPYISSVLYNRLDAGMRLQCDVTITYVEGAIKPFISGDKNRYNSHYNTYKCEGLPAGAICNPGLNAIKAALSPADTDYFYFVTDANKKYYYAAAWEEHLENIEMAGDSH